MCLEFIGLNIILHAEVLDKLLLMLQPPGFPFKQANTSPVYGTLWLANHALIRWYWLHAVRNETTQETTAV